MFRARGFRLVIEYFLFNHLFDIIHKIDTHSWSQKSKNIENEIYMATWGKDVKKSAQLLEKYLKKPIEEYDLYDLGSGKGKVLIIWSKIFPKHPSINGIEIDEELFNIANKNFNKLKIFNINNYLSDVLSFNFYKKSKNIFFMYNPFGEQTLKKFFTQNKFIDSYVIYHNPKHHKIMIKCGFSCIYEFQNYRSGSSFKIYK